jgi:hypothetical protein
MVTTLFFVFFAIAQTCSFFQRVDYRYRPQSLSAFTVAVLTKNELFPEHRTGKIGK